MFSRIHLNDFFLNTYYYFWTNFWFIPSFVTTSLYLILWFWNINLIKLNHFCFILLFILLGFEFNNYWFLNLFSWEIYLNSENFNLLLTNSINKYHPFLFYISLILLLYYSVATTLNKYNLQARFWSNHFTNFFLKKRFLILPIIVYTLFLGSWWALQEGSWGGWWNWDPSEVFGLILMLLIIRTIHLPLHYKHMLIFCFEVRIKCLILLLIYLFIQLNFNLVSHNFGIKVDQFINTAQILLIISGFVFFILCTLLKTYLNVYIHYIYQIKKFKIYTNYSKILLISLLSFLVFMECLVSFYPLINDFLWKLLKINFINIIVNLNLIIILLLLFNLLFLWNFVPIYTLLIMYISLCFSNLYLILLIFTFIKFKNSYLFHFVLCLFIILNLIIFNKTFTLWNQYFISPNLNLFLPVSDSYIICCKTNSIFFEISFLETLNNTLNESSWNFFCENTSPEIHSFIQNTNYQNSIQLLLNGLFSQKFLIQVVDVSIIPCLTTFLWLWIFIKNIFNKLIIIF